MYRKFASSESGKQVIFNKMAVLYADMTNFFLPESFIYAHTVSGVTEEGCSLLCHADSRCSHFKHLPANPNEIGDCAVNFGT